MEVKSMPQQQSLALLPEAGRTLQTVQEEGQYTLVLRTKIVNIFRTQSHSNKPTGGEQMDGE
jgi:hypothetical protein